VIRVSQQIEVSKPVCEAFAFLSDLENNPKWITGVVSTTKLSEGPIGKGTRLLNKFKERGGVEYEETILSLESDKSLSFEIHVPGMPIKGDFRFEPKGSGTVISFTEEVVPEKFGYRLMSPILKVMMQRQLNKDFRKLKTLLDT